MAVAERKVKRIDTFGSGELFRFETPGDTLDVSIMAYRPNITTKLGQVDIVDGINLDTGEPVSFFVTAGLKAYNWQELIGNPVRVEYEGEEKNPRSGRTFKSFACYLIEPDEG